MPLQRTVPRVCAQCGGGFMARVGEVNAGGALYCDRQCFREFQRAHRVETFDRAAWLAAARARNRAFVDEVNARTVCVHCGSQPIEWHNPEHVELNREGFRISTLRSGGVAVARIQAEMDRCTPLCRSCHMREDGRMRNLRPQPKQPPKPCGQCERLYKPLARGLCKRCYSRLPDQIEKNRQYAHRRLEQLRAGGTPLPGME